MKVKALILVFGTTLFMACASPEQRAKDQMDSSSTRTSDTLTADTTARMDGRSGDNGTGTDTVNTAEQKALKESDR